MRRESTPRPCAFCALGAVDAVRGDYIGISPPELWAGECPLHIDPAKKALHSAMMALRGDESGTFTVNTYNDDDETAHADIMAMYGRAIEMETPA